MVSEADFVAAQAINATPEPSDGSARRYLLTGLIRCGLCDRRMDAHWVHDRPGYRCRHGATSAKAKAADQRKPLYVREDHALTSIARQHGDDTDPQDVPSLLRAIGTTISCLPGSNTRDLTPSGARNDDDPSRNARGHRGG